MLVFIAAKPDEERPLIVTILDPVNTFRGKRHVASECAEESCRRWRLGYKSALEPVPDAHQASLIRNNAR
jgi:hypothetical protein